MKGHVSEHELLLQEANDICEELLHLAQGDIPFLCLGFDGKLTANIHGAATSVAFVQLFLYFHKWYQENGHLNRTEARLTLWVLEIKQYYRRLCALNNNDEYGKRLEEMQSKCQVMQKHFSHKNFFVAFQDSRNGDIFSWTGDEDAGYNPTFHFFDTILRFVRQAHGQGKSVHSVYKDISYALDDILLSTFGSYSVFAETAPRIFDEMKIQ